MNYAIIKDYIVISIADFEPSIEDLESRGESFVTCDPAILIGYTYDGTEFSPPMPIVIPFVQFQASKWETIKSHRDIEERDPLPYLGKLLDFNTLASERLTWAIQTAITASLTAQSFSIDWTTSDGTVLSMNERDILGIPIAVATRSNAIHQKERMYALAIESALTEEDLSVIIWS